MRTAHAIVLALLVLTAAFADAQVTARQGEPEHTQERIRFKSPMILDLPLALSDPSLWGKKQYRSMDEVSLRKYICDGVHFIDFVGSAKRQRDGKVKLTYNFMLGIEPGVDKLATVRVGIVAGDREVVARVHENIDAEEGKLAPGQVVLIVPEQMLLTEPRPTMRISLKIVDND